MLKKQYFDTNTNKVTTTSITAAELLVEIEDELKKYETLLFNKEIKEEKK